MPSFESFLTGDDTFFLSFSIVFSSVGSLFYASFSLSCFSSTIGDEPAFSLTAYILFVIYDVMKMLALNNY